MANRTRKNSPSNVAERPVVQGAESANVPGATGHALASVIINTARAIGEQLQKQALSRKDRLAELLKLDKPGIAAFIADMVAQQQQINADAKAVPNRALMDYLTDFPSENSVYVETSMWLGMAKAVDLGWKPVNDKGEAIAEQANWPEWRLLTMSAAKARNSQGQPSADPKNPQRAPSGQRKGRGRPEVAPEVKAANAAKNALKDNKGNPLPKNNRNLSEVIRLQLTDATVQELKEVCAVCETMLDLAIKAEQAQAELTAKMAQAAKDGKLPGHGEQQEEGKQTQTTSNGATVKHSKAGSDKPGQQQEEGTVETPTAANPNVRTRVIRRTNKAQA